MTVNVWVKWAAIRYAMLAIVGGGLLIGSVWRATYVWQRLDNRARDPYPPSRLHSSADSCDPRRDLICGTGRAGLVQFLHDILGSRNVV